MQKICPLPGGIKAYLENPDCLVNSQTAMCPFCKGDDEHVLRRHGWYHRIALVALAGGFFCLAVRRLLCSRTGRTVSLLPDFCLPGRQHGPAILGLFLWGVVKGLTLREALQKARGEVPSHSVAQSLRDGFLRRSHRLRAYLAGLVPRAIEPPKEIPRERRRLAKLVFALVEGFADPAIGFTHHGYHFHRAFQLGLA